MVDKMLNDIHEVVVVVAEDLVDKVTVAEEVDKVGLTAVEVEEAVVMVMVHL